MKLYEFLHIHAIEAQHERKNCMSGRSAPQPTDVDFCDRRLLRPVDDRPELSAQSGAVAAPGAEMSRVPSTNLSEKVGSLTPPTPGCLGSSLFGAHLSTMFLFLDLQNVRDKLERLSVKSLPKER